MIDIVILIACALCGYALGKYLEKRVKRKGNFYGDLTRYIALLKVNIERRQLELGKFNEEFGTNCSAVFRDYLQSSKFKVSLTTAQKENVAAFFNNLGCVSSQELIKHIEYYDHIFATDNRQIEVEVSKASIYVKLGILLGVMVGIVLM